MIKTTLNPPLKPLLETFSLTSFALVAFLGVMGLGDYIYSDEFPTNTSFYFAWGFIFLFLSAPISLTMIVSKIATTTRDTLLALLFFWLVGFALLLDEYTLEGFVSVLEFMFFYFSVPAFIYLSFFKKIMDK